MKTEIDYRENKNNVPEIEYRKVKNLIYEHCDRLTDNLNNKIKEVDNLKETNEILKDKVKHLENLLNLQDIAGNIDREVNFRDNNHKTKRNGNGNLITYYTK